MEVFAGIVIYQWLILIHEAYAARAPSGYEALAATVHFSTSLGLLTAADSASADWLFEVADVFRWPCLPVVALFVTFGSRRLLNLNMIHRIIRCIPCYQRRPWRTIFQISL